MGVSPKTALLRFSAQNPIYPVFKVHRTYCLVFAFQYLVIISCLKLLLCKASIKISRVYCQQESSNTLPCFPLTARGGSLQQEER